MLLQPDRTVAGRLHHTSEGFLFTFPPLKGGALEGSSAPIRSAKVEDLATQERLGRLAGYMDTVAGQISEV